MAGSRQAKLSPNKQIALVVVVGIAILVAICVAFYLVQPMSHSA